MAGARCTLTIGLGDQRYEVGEGEELTFGRSPRTTLCLDPSDLGISRVAGSLEADAGVWWLVNKSTVRPLEVVDDVGIRTVLPPGRRLAVTAPITVIVEGAMRRHALTVDLPEEALEGGPGGKVIASRQVPAGVADNSLQELELSAGAAPALGIGPGDVQRVEVAILETVLGYRMHRLRFILPVTTPIPRATPTPPPASSGPAPLSSSGSSTCAPG